MSERNGHPGRAYDENRDNWSAWADSPDAPEAAGVTDEMVERARLAFHAYVNSGPVQPDYSDAWRAALEAALRVREGGE